MALQALIWDVDGTLAETEDEGHRPAFNLAFSEAGLPWVWDSALYGELLAVTGGKERIAAWWQRVDPAGAAAPGAEAAIRRLHERKTAHYLQLLDSGAITLLPGVQRLLKAARAAGLRQAIATTTSESNVKRLIDVAMGDAGQWLFDVVGAGDVVPHKKPAPDIYLWVLERLRLAPRDCLAIEDSPPGVAAAQAAGVPVLLVRGRYTPAANVPVPGPSCELPGLAQAALADLQRCHAAATASP